MGDVSNEGFLVKVAEGSMIEARKLTSAEKIAGYSALAIGAAKVAAAVVVVVVFAGGM